MTDTLAPEWGPFDRRPPIVIDIVETKWGPWDEWAYHHHYLHDAGRMPFSTAFTGFDRDSGDPVAFVGMSGMVAGGRRVARACRLVVAPEWQGAGVGVRFLEAVAKREARGEGFIGEPVPTYLHTAHPSLVSALKRSNRWKQVSQALAGNPAGRPTAVGRPALGNMKFGGHTRSVAGFRFRGLREGE